MRASGNDALLERNGLRLAGFLLCTTGGFFHLHMVGANKSAIAAHHRHLAHLGHGSQPAGEFGHHLFLVSAQLVHVHCRLAEVNAKCRHVRHLVHHRRHMQQGLARDATHVQADAAELRVTLHDNDLEPEVGGAKGSRVAAGASAEYHDIAFHVHLAGVTGRRWRGNR